MSACDNEKGAYANVNTLSTADKCSIQITECSICWSPCHFRGKRGLYLCGHCGQCYHADCITKMTNPTCSVCNSSVVIQDGVTALQALALETEREQHEKTKASLHAARAERHELTQCLETQGEEHRICKRDLLYYLTRSKAAEQEYENCRKDLAHLTAGNIFQDKTITACHCEIKKLYCCLFLSSVLTVIALTLVVYLKL